jgi:hypothetical protein
MPAAKDPETRDYPVRAHFRRKERNPKTGIDVSVSYDPDGTDGWPGAKPQFTGVPGSDEVEELLAHGLLFPIPDEESSSTTSSKES